MTLVMLSLVNVRTFNQFIKEVSYFNNIAQIVVCSNFHCMESGGSFKTNALCIGYEIPSRPLIP